MIRTFIQTREFSRLWDGEGLNTDDLLCLEMEILSNPKAGPVIRGTGRLRKLRYAAEGRGKSGGFRVCYVDFEKQETIYLITLFPKNVKDNLSRAECNEIRKLIENPKPPAVLGRIE